MRGKEEVFEIKKKSFVLDLFSLAGWGYPKSYCLTWGRVSKVPLNEQGLGIGRSLEAQVLTGS